MPEAMPNPFEKSEQEQNAAEAEIKAAFYAMDKHGQPVFGTTAAEVKQKILEANQGYA